MVSFWILTSPAFRFGDKITSKPSGQFESRQWCGMHFSHYFISFCFFFVLVISLTSLIVCVLDAYIVQRTSRERNNFLIYDTRDFRAHLTFSNTITKTFRFHRPSRIGFIYKQLHSDWNATLSHPQNSINVNKIARNFSRGASPKAADLIKTLRHRGALLISLDFIHRLRMIHDSNFNSTNQNFRWQTFLRDDIIFPQIKKKINFDHDSKQISSCFLIAGLISKNLLLLFLFPPHRHTLIHVSSNNKIYKNSIASLDLVLLAQQPDPPAAINDSETFRKRILNATTNEEKASK